MILKIISYFQSKIVTEIDNQIIKWPSSLQIVAYIYLFFSPVSLSVNLQARTTRPNPKQEDFELKVRLSDTNCSWKKTCILWIHDIYKKNLIKSIENSKKIKL